MGWLKRAFGPRLDTLITCVVDREGDTWDVVWVSGGRVPASLKDHSLNATADRAAASVAALYSGEAQAEKAELQFAIYPWKGNPGKVILDITTGADGFVARDIQGTEIAIRGASLEDLVQKAETMVPNPGETMFRWIRRVSELPKA